MRQDDFRLGRLGQVAVTARDLGRATAFYRDILGLRLLLEVPGKMAFFDCDGVRLMLGVPEAPEFDHAASILYYRVDDIGRAFDTLSRRGVAFRGEPHRIADMGDHELWMAFFDDSEGNVLALMSEVSKAR